MRATHGQDGDTRDIILQSGADLVLNRSGGAILQALGEHAMVAFEDGIGIERPARRPRPAPLARLGALASRLWRAAATKLQPVRGRDELHGLSDYVLRDIGLRRSEIDRLGR